MTVTMEDLKSSDVPEDEGGRLRTRNLMVAEPFQQKGRRAGNHLRARERRWLRHAKRHGMTWICASVSPRHRDYATFRLEGFRRRATELGIRARVEHDRRDAS